MIETYYDVEPIFIENWNYFGLSVLLNKVGHYLNQLNLLNFVPF